MKKLIPIVLVVVLVLSGLGASAFNTTPSIKKTTIEKQQATSAVFSQPTFNEKDGYLLVEMNGATTTLLDPTKPEIPVYVKTFQLPWGSKNIHFTATTGTVNSIQISQDIMPVRIAPVSKMSQRTAYILDESVYGSSEFYPNTWFSTDLGAGRNENNNQVIFAKIICYPIRYSPLTDTIQYTDGFTIDVSYDAPLSSPQPVSTYDMVVIAPKSFESKLQPLIDFKNTKGVKTTFKSVEDIMSEYTGADPPEQVKMFIKYAYDTWNITYAMLVGGLKSHIFAKDKDGPSYGSKAWNVPVRYMSIPEEDDEGCLSDLYYGCLYDANGTFDSWDSNGDGIYGAWGAGLGIPNDKFDMNTEVYVGRLAVANANEVKTVVNKIITYESTGPAAKPWYKNFVGVGGKTFAYYQGQPDGEYLSDLAASYIKNVIPDQVMVQCYTTNRDTGGLTPIPKDIISSMSAGAGFVDFEGHGNPYSWNTIWFDGVYPKNWTGGMNLFRFPQVQNGDKLPVVIVGGCHNALYNVSMLATALDKTGGKYFCYGIPIPVCFCWGLVVKPRGGAIASTGCTGYGFGSQSNPVSLSAALEMNFFWEIGNNSVTNLATAHGQAITKFISETTVEKSAAFCITNWALFGDPSLKFGGYSS
jgi:hypothetical protein